MGRNDVFIIRQIQDDLRQSSIAKSFLNRYFIDLMTVKAVRKAWSILHLCSTRAEGHSRKEYLRIRRKDANVPNVLILYRRNALDDSNRPSNKPSPCMHL